MSKTQALAKVEQQLQPIATVQQFHERIAMLQESAFVCCPFINLDSIPANYLVSERVVRVNPDPRAKDVYFSGLFCDGTKENPKTVALTRRALMRIWIAAAGNILWSKQTGDTSDPRVVQWSVGGEIRQIDGNVIQVIGSKRIDLRDGSDDTRGMTDKQLAGARAHIYEMAETKAMLRLVRKAMDLSDTYSVEDLRTKLFVTYALVPNLDTTDVETRRMVTAAQLGIVDQVYGSRQSVQSVPIVETAAPPIDLEGEPIEPEQPEQPFDLEGVPAPVVQPSAAPAQVCGCPCGHQKEVTTAVAEGTLKAVGSIRCQSCYPAKNFDYEGHKHLPSLELKLRPDLTPAVWLASNQG